MPLSESLEIAIQMDRNQEELGMVQWIYTNFWSNMQNPHSLRKRTEKGKIKIITN